MVNKNVRFVASKILESIHKVAMPLIPKRRILCRYGGGKIYLDLTQGANAVLRALTLYEQPVTKLIMKGTVKGKIAVDVGANDGYYTLIMARLAGKNGRVISIEPDKEAFMWIKKSIAKNKYENIKAYNAAASDTNGKCKMYLGKVTGWSSLVYDKQSTKNEAVETSSVRLDDLLSKEDKKNVSVIKIDTQGSELKVIRGAKQIIRQSRGIRIIMDAGDLKTQNERDELMNILRKEGFVILEINNGMKEIQQTTEDTTSIYAERRG